MVRIPSLPRRQEPASARDENIGGRIVGRDAEPATDRTEPARDAQPVTPTSPAVGPTPAQSAPVVTDQTGVAEADQTDHTVRPHPTESADVVVDRGPRPRTSLLATLSLIFGLAGALFVLTGVLAAYGIALGGIGALLGVAGLSATRRRHIAGTTEAMIGMLLGLGAVVTGVLAMTGQFAWPSTDGDWTQRFREWLDSQFADRF